MRSDTAANAELVREIVRVALGDALEILLAITVMESQNAGGVNDRLSDAGAAQAGIVVRNALITHLVTRITRAYSDSRAGDLHLRRAFEILRDNPQIRAVFQQNASDDALREAEAYFQKCRGDHRLPRIEHFRDKIVVHLGQLKDIPAPLYKELFAFAHATIEAIEKLAFAIGVANVRVNDNIDAEPAAEAFWKPWKLANADRP